MYPSRPSTKTAAEWDPLAGPVEKCAAPDSAPTGLSVTPGDDTLDLSWTALSEDEAGDGLPGALAADEVSVGRGGRLAGVERVEGQDGLTTGATYTV